MKKIFSITILAVFALAISLQAQTASIEVEAFSPYEIEEMGLEHASTGLSVVGVGETVYLSGSEAGGAEVTAYAWSLETVPSGSAAALDSNDTELIAFSPDVTGEFVVKLSITTADGTAETTVTIVSSTYVGVGIIDDLIANPAASSCVCHTDKVTEWAGTGHSVIFKEAMEGTLSDHYSESCIECHTVGYFPGADNGGFADVADEVGWTFPDTLAPETWDSLKTNYPHLAALGGIQCENCHGPASQHVSTFDPTKVEVSLDAGACNRCHDEPWRHIKSLQWERSAHATGTSFARGSSSSCAPCHSAEGLVAKLDPASNLSTTGTTPVTCQACHDPHTATLREVASIELENGDVIDWGGEGKLCMSCHHSRQSAETYSNEYASHYGPHHSPQTDMLAGRNAVTFGMYLGSSTHKNVLENACVSCHMAPSPHTGTADLVDDYVGEHTFAIQHDGVENVAVCQSCHGAIASFNDIEANYDYDEDGTVESAMEEVEGLLEEVAMMLPPLGEPTVEVTAEYNRTQLKAAYNYLFVEDDGSKGMHNFQYSVDILTVAKMALENGILVAGDILGIGDVPNDQGYQVQIEWSRFGGDGVSDNPVKSYSIWRNDSSVPMPAKDVKIYNSFKQVPVDIAEANASKLVVNGETWTFVGSVPAAALDEYSAVVPTLYNTMEGDTVFSTFMVAGLTDQPSMNVFCEPDSGFSVDNLNPNVPAGVSITIGDAGIRISWDESTDKDFDYYAIYRSTESGFDPSQTEPYATLTSGDFIDPETEVNVTYYYRVAAFDFNGNHSEYSDEVSAVVTQVVAEAGVPEDYGLAQNYPNPFNPTTTIKFAVPEATNITVTIFDATGKMIEVLVDEYLNAGYYSIQWNAENYASGIYFYRMETGKFTQTQKMLLLK